MTIDCNKIDEHVQITDWTQFTEYIESTFAQTTMPTNIHIDIILMADKQNMPKCKMHSNCMLLPDDMMQNHTKK